MSKVRLEACTTCSLNQAKLRAVIERMKAEHPDKLEVIHKECLELCQDDAAFRIDGAKLFVPASGAALLESKISAALKKLDV